VSICTQADRSKSKNSSAFSCAEAAFVKSHPLGKACFPEPLKTCRSVMTTFPQYLGVPVAGCSTGVPKLV